MKLTDKMFAVYKIGEKKSSPYGYPKEYLVIDRASIKKLDNGCLMCNATNVTSDLETSWFRTSPIINWTKVKNGYKVETNNSYYKLIEVK